MRRCEELTEALDVHRQGETNANERIVKLESDIANMEKLVKENEDKVKELQRIHGFSMGEAMCVEESNQVWRKDM